MAHSRGVGLEVPWTQVGRERGHDRSVPYPACAPNIMFLRMSRTNALRSE